MPPAARPRVAVVDYGMGNLASVGKALDRSGAEVRIEQEPAGVRAAEAVVLPGVGAFGDGMRRLHVTGLDAAVLDRIAAGVPFLGICLGLQMLFEGSDEGGDVEGLAVLAGRVRRLHTGLKVPHIGWNDLDWLPPGAPMARGLPSPAAVYFVHSYAAHADDTGVVAATTDYGDGVVAAVVRDNVWAMQFHPEKSSRVGLALLGNFVALARREGRAS